VLALAAITAATASCGGSSSDSSVAIQNSSQQADLSEDGIRAAAIAFANAFFTGSVLDVAAVLDPSCAPEDWTPSSEEIASADAELARLRQGLEARAGIDAAAIAIRGVVIRNFTGDAGEAEVQYSVPIEVTGNDNWINYAFDAGQWHVAGCDIRWPIGGSSTSHAIDTTTTASV